MCFFSIPKPKAPPVPGPAPKTPEETAKKARTDPRIKKRRKAARKGTDALRRPITQSTPGLNIPTPAASDIAGGG